MMISLVAAFAIGTTIPDVVVKKTEGRVQLTVDGKPFPIKGVGLGNAPMTMLKEAGGNTIRTWGTDQTDKVIDEAEKLGLKVIAGIWIQHANHMDYGNAAEVEKQKQAVLADVRRLKNRSSIIVWGIGNEMHGFGKPDPRVWKAVNDIIVEIKKIDSRPTMTVIAELGNDHLNFIKKDVPAVDIIGVNSYGGAFSLAERYRQAGGDKPIVLTEFGPLGPWEVPKTGWGAAQEHSSTEKADFYRRAQAEVEKHKDLFLGSCVFLWGDKQEATATWFGMFLPGGGRTAAVDVMQEFWTGKPPKNRVPVVSKLSLPEGIVAGSSVRATLEARDPEGARLRVVWKLKQEAEKYGEGGFPEDKQPEFPQAIKASTPSSVTFEVPKSGAFRLFAYIYDDAGGAATINVPFFAGAR